MHRTEFIDGNGLDIPSGDVYLYVVNMQRRWRNAPEISTLPNTGVEHKDTDNTIDCMVIKIMQEFAAGFSGQTVDVAMQKTIRTQTGFAICAALHAYGVRRFASAAIKRV